MVQAEAGFEPAGLHTKSRKHIKLTDITIKGEFPEAVVYQFIHRRYEQSKFCH
jgi:hypothetical protein